MSRFTVTITTQAHPSPMAGAEIDRCDGYPWHADPDGPRFLTFWDPQDHETIARSLLGTSLERQHARLHLIDVRQIPTAASLTQIQHWCEEGWDDTCLEPVITIFSADFEMDEDYATAVRECVMRGDLAPALGDGGEEARWTHVPPHVVEALRPILDDDLPAPRTLSAPQLRALVKRQSRRHRLVSAT